LTAVRISIPIHATQDPFQLGRQENMLMIQGGTLLICAVWLAAADGEQIRTSTPEKTGLHFEVTLSDGLLSGPRDGRLLIVLGRKPDPEPRTTVGETGMNVPPVLGVDVKGFAAGVKARVDENAITFPLPHLSRLTPGRYFIQAVFDHNCDLRLANAPGNLYSDIVARDLDPTRGETVRLELTHRTADESLPAETEFVKYVRIRSELLSRHHGRPIFLRAGVIVPRGYEQERQRRYPLRVHIGGFGSRFTEVSSMMSAESAFRRTWLANDTPPMVLLHLDGAGPFGDPYQVNSANNGPFGDAIVGELIPEVEKRFRLIGRPQARVLDGESTGGWVSLALQIFYPDYFQGAWAHAPDPVDFRAFELINIYQHDNAYVNEHGFERPAARELTGEVLFTVRHECQRERVLGRGNQWVLSGKDWGSWNAVFGPRGPDGLPKPLWDGRTGQIDRTVVDHWMAYDLRLVLEKNWPVLGPKLRGKIRIWVGEADDYFLNNAVHLLDDFLQRARPAAEHRIIYAPGQGHGWRGLSEAQMIKEMVQATSQGER
jgi:hypothetical protein